MRLFTLIVLLMSCGIACNVFTDLESLRSDGPAPDECAIDDPCEGCTQRNACGGCNTLAGTPGDQCGVCNSGAYECDGEILTCAGDVGDEALNACGGCSVLEGQQGDACGVCLSGQLRCDRQESLICDGEREDTRNECGGCDSLMGQLGGSCGTCDSGVLACSEDNEALNCQDDLGDEALNACGGCEVLVDAPGDECGEGGCGQLVCESGVLICDSEEGSIWYRDSDNDQFGDPQIPSDPSCNQPSGYVGNNQDCNDRDPDINPDEEENADDNIDQDCDGLLVHRVVPFTQGSDIQEVGRHEDEVMRTVNLTRNIAAGRQEVTRALWAKYLPDTPAVDECEQDDCPVACVNLYEAMYFLNQWSANAGLESCYTLNDCTGTPGTGRCSGNEAECNLGFQCSGYTMDLGADCSGYRLPTEAEWEFLARAGTTTAHYRGDLTTDRGCSDTNLDEISWYCGNAGNRPQAVGAKASNPFGLQDILGNVGEWTQDTYHIWDSRGVMDPLHEGGVDQVWRGGNYSNQIGILRSAQRDRQDLHCRSRTIGFRAVQTIP